MANKFQQRFLELEIQLTKVQATKQTSQLPYPFSGFTVQVDSTLKLGWEVKVKHLLESACGIESQHFKHFEEAAQGGSFLTSWDILENLAIIFLAAKEDFEGGMFDDIRRLVRADVLDDFLSQAEELLASGFNEASVGLAGAVLEDTLRKLCDKHSIPYAQKTAIDTLNISLAKAQVYALQVQKRITQIADLRNGVDHGRSLGTVKPADAEDMLKWVRRFVTDYLN
jgi:hypothetical protein